MKSFFCLSFLLFIASGFSQNTNKIYLSDTLNEERMGVWSIGKFKIHVQLDHVEKRLRSMAENFENSGQQDSIFAITSRRYFKAAEELKNAENGFNLQLLVAYYGLENEALNNGNSVEVNDIVRGLVLQGLAVVYHKDLRIHELSRKEISERKVNYIRKTIIYYKWKKNVIYEWKKRLAWF